SVDNLGKCLDNLEKFMHQENKISQLVKVALLHAWFEMIHPFLDGNGRLGRLLIALYLSTKNILHKPTLYLSKFFKKNQLSYYETLSNISAKGDAEAFIKFFLTGIIETASEAIDISRNIAVLREEDLVKLSCINRYGEKLLEIYNNLFAKPTVSIDTIVKKLEVSNATAGRILEKLCGTGILELLDSRKRNKIFIYKKYIDLFGDD
ncbi:MAG: Fic family protein, partial [Firmicutes bacterium]|nr:Fic family protein [Bacillota bacterium]